MGPGREDTPGVGETMPSGFRWGHLASGGLPGFRWTNRSCGRDCQAAETLRECRAAQMELRHPPGGRKKTAAGTNTKSLRLFKLHSNGLEPLTFGSVDPQGFLSRF